MTGGGFGGCTVTLLKTSAIEKTIQNIKVSFYHYLKSNRMFMANQKLEVEIRS